MIQCKKIHVKVNINSISWENACHKLDFACDLEMIDTFSSKTLTLDILPPRVFIPIGSNQIHRDFKSWSVLYKLTIGTFFILTSKPETQQGSRTRAERDMALFPPTDFCLFGDLFLFHPAPRRQSAVLLTRHWLVCRIEIVRYPPWSFLLW